MNLVVKDAVRQILGRVASAIGGFLVIKIITPYLGPLRFGDYSTILKYFAIWSAFADFGVYVLALKQLGAIKNKNDKRQDLLVGNTEGISAGLSVSKELQITYGKFVSTRMFMICVVYTLALVVAYLIPAYTANPYLIRGLPLGMLFSASFMTAGIIQIPLQLFWKMEQLSIGLILARVVQLAILLLTVYLRYTQTPVGITAFMLIISSVLASGLTQAIYVRYTGRNYLPLQRHRDRSFTKNIIRKNRQYGLAYYLSSFHTLIVLILLSIFYPTSAGRTYVGTRALALALIEILLIIPSALGNSLIHKVANTDLITKQKSFGALLELVRWIGCLVICGFVLFAPHIVLFLGGSEYLSTPGHIGSDTILPFLGIVICFSFIKQIFNYIFVSTDLQNKLLRINLFGVIIGCTVGIPLLLFYNIIGGIIMQLTLEIAFVIGAIFIAWRHQVIPHFSWKHISIIGSSMLLLVSGYYISAITLTPNGWTWLGYALLFIIIWTLLSLPWLKTTLKKL